MPEPRITVKPGYRTETVGRFATGQEGRLALEVSTDGRHVLVRMLDVNGYARASSFFAVDADALIRSMRFLAGSDEL